MAIANIGLDLLGQARFLLARAGKADGGERDEDSFAYFREVPEFRNVRLAEAGGGHFGHLIARLLVFSTWRLALLRGLGSAVDPVLAAIAVKGVNELTYHRDYAARWTVRLGDGTELSHRRMQDGLDATWPLVGELFTPHPIELSVGVDPTGLRGEFDDVLEQVLSAATLARPETPERPELLGRDGVHSEELAPLLAELQGVARAHPGAPW
jgi:ring-1,2-phenylacetyl-CoA epoxidase subunit PaaC